MLENLVVLEGLVGCRSLVPGYGFAAALLLVVTNATPNSIAWPKLAFPAIHASIVPVAKVN